MKEASQVLKKVAHDWPCIAVQLSFEHGEIRRIETDYSNKGSERCLMEMLGVWIGRSTPQPTWEELASAMDVRGHNNLALHIRNKYYN